MPVKVSVARNGLDINKVPLTDLNINEIILTYNVPNSNFVAPGSQLSNLYPNWKLRNPPTWNNGQLVLDLIGTKPLDDNIINAGNVLCSVPFEVFLDTSNGATNINLQSVQLLSGPGVPISPICDSTTKESGALSVILKCGDSTLRMLMSGKGNLINVVYPATPDPVTGGHVTFSYANRGATNITLSILDVLGQEVMRP